MCFVQHLSFARLPLNWASQERLITFLLKAAAFYQVASCVTRLRQPTSKRGGGCGVAESACIRCPWLHKPFLYLSLSLRPVSILFGCTQQVMGHSGRRPSRRRVTNRTKSYRQHTRTYVCVYSCTLCDKLRLVLIYITFRRQLPRLRAKPDILSFIFPY